MSYQCLSIKGLSAGNKPRERLMEYGTEALSEAELLAIILSSGGRGVSALDLSQHLLKNFDGFKGLVSSDIKQLVNFKGIGIAKACAIKASCEIALRLKTSVNTYNVVVSKPADVFEILKKDLYSKKNERLYLISLDLKNRIISKDLISIGTVSETLVDIREIFVQALMRNAISVILAHNHPSNDSTPSDQDILLTKRLAEAGTIVGIPVVDHLIICDDSFSSLKAKNLFNQKGGD